MKSIVMKHIQKNLNVAENFLNHYKTEELKKIETPLLREKLLIYWSYYDFTKNEESLEILEKIYKIVLEINKIKIPDNSLTLSIIILKSFLSKKIFNLGEKYINSDEIFNYCTESYNKYLILEKIYVPERQIQCLILQILDILSFKKIIKEKIIKMNGTFYKTHKYYSLDVETYCCSNNFFAFSCTEFKLIEYGESSYITTGHHSRTYLVNKKNFNSKKSFKIKNTNYLMQKINTKLYIDDEYQKLLKIHIKGDIENIKEEIK